MKLFYKPGACSLAAHIILRENKINFTLECVDLKNKCLDDGRDFYLINPKGQVPVLMLDDGSILTENIAILQYLAESIPNCQLLSPIGTTSRYKILEWLGYISTELHKDFTPLFRSNTPEEYRRIVRSSLEDKLAYLNKSLNGKFWICGIQFTIADAYLFTILRWANKMLNIGKLNHIIHYMQCISQRSSVNSALVAEGLE